MQLSLNSVLLLSGLLLAYGERGLREGDERRRRMSPSSSSSSKSREYVCKSRKFTCPTSDTKPSHQFGGAVGVCNRVGGTFSLVDHDTLETLAEQALPNGGQPMYFGLSPAKSEIWVGDRANNRLVIYKAVGCELIYDGYVETAAGLFHSMITQRGAEYPIIATTCDIDNVIVVHDLTTRRLLGTMQPPQAVVDAGAKPHDITTNGDYIFATFLAGENGVGYVASYSADDFSLMAVFETAADPHVSIRDDSNLFIAAQGGDEPGFVITVSVPDLVVINSVTLPSPHGMFLAFGAKHLYVTNIGQGGNMAISVFDASTGDLRTDCPEVVTTNATPHNPAVSDDGTQLFITHSGGTSTKNSAFDIRYDGCLDPSSERVFETNLNPFGIAIIAPAPALQECANAGY